MDRKTQINAKSRTQINVLAVILHLHRKQTLIYPVYGKMYKREQSLLSTIPMSQDQFSSLMCMDCLLLQKICYLLHLVAKMWEFFHFAECLKLKLRKQRRPMGHITHLRKIFTCFQYHFTN